jgi:hypothetical protein
MVVGRTLLGDVLAGQGLVGSSLVVDRHKVLLVARWIRHFADLRVCLQIASDAILSHWMPGSEGVDSVGRDAMSPGVAGLVLVEGVPLLHPEPQVFEAMLEGWRNQMLARNLAVSTITSRTLQVRAFQEYANVYPWEWSASLADEWFVDLRSIRHCTRSTVRGYQVAIRGFCSYVIDPGYGWVAECAPVRHAPGAGDHRGERGSACCRHGVGTVEAGVHPRRAAGVV